MGHLLRVQKVLCRASKIIYNLPKDMASSHVLNFTNWTTIRLNYKLEIYYFSTQIMLSFQITFLRESLVSKKVISHYKWGRCFYSEIHSRFMRLISLFMLWYTLPAISSRFFTSVDSLRLFCHSTEKPPLRNFLISFFLSFLKEGAARAAQQAKV